MRALSPGWFQRTIALGLLALGSLTIAAPVLASLSQGYATANLVVVGSMVSLDAKTTGNVVVADLTNSERLFGVAVAPSSASVSLGGTNSTGQVQVATTGIASALVSTAGGDIKVGDYISISPVAGVGQKASGKVRIIGTAQADFTGAGEGVTKRTIDTTTGKREVAIGQIPVVIAVATYSKDDGSLDGNVIPTWAQSITNAIAGRNVAPIRVIIAALILVVSLVSVSVLLYAAVRNSIISIGRNPLSRSSVLRGLLQVILIAIGILAAATGAMYVVITR